MAFYYCKRKNANINCTKKQLAETICTTLNIEYSILENKTDSDKRDYEVSSNKFYSTGYKPDIDLDIPGAKITAVLKAAAVMQLPEIVLMCDGSAVYLQALDSQNPSSDDYKQELDCDNQTTHFKIIFGTENFKMMPYDYNVKIKSQISQFTCLSDNRPGLIYWVAAKANSTFGE